MDSLTVEKRSWNMSRIRSRDTKPERLVRSLLHSIGYRFRLHVKKLPGCPDIVLAKHKTIIFIHGCFWHRHAGCKYAYIPKSKKAFWGKKFQQNLSRDEMVMKELMNLGWNVHIIWECEIKDIDHLKRKIENFFA